MGSVIIDDDLKSRKGFAVDADVMDEGTSTMAPSTFDGTGTETWACTSASTAYLAQDEAVEDVESSSGSVQELPSKGSEFHGLGDCKPCAWFNKPQGCTNGKDCRHCHLCPEGEMKQRKKLKIEALRKIASVADDERGDEMAIVTAFDTKANIISEFVADTENTRTDKPLENAEYIEPPPGLDLADSTPIRAADGEIPSVGSALHGHGACKPCAWFYKPKGCSNGKECMHCHLCPEGELKSRKKTKIAILKKEEEDEKARIFEPAPCQSYLMDPIYDGLPLHMPFSPPFWPNGMPMEPPVPLYIPSVGSSLHGAGLCKPCAWFWKVQGCANGQDCLHCHVCPENETKERRKIKVSVLRSLGQGQRP